MRFVSAVLVLPLLLVSMLAQAGPARERLDAFYRDVTTMRAEFVQTRISESGAEKQESKGTFLLQRPGRFRFEYKEPYKQLYVADGTKIWSYDPDLEQVIVKVLDGAVGDTPMLLLSGSHPLESRFTIVELGKGNESLQWLELLPKQGESSFELVRLGFNKKGLRVMELLDGLGQTTRMQFHKVEVNPSLDAKLFQFTPPEGVDVIDGQS